VLRFKVSNVGLWRIPSAAAELLGALTGHPSLRELSIFFNAIGGAQQAAGAALEPDAG
jgi:hypothetical protein